MHNIKKIIFNIGLPAFIIGGLFYYLYQNKSTFIKVIDVSTYHIAFLVFLILLTWVINSTQTLITIRAVGIKINFFENLAVFIAMILGNYLPGRFGTLLRMQYFKKVYKLEYSKFGGIVGLRILLLSVLAGALGTVGIIGNGIITSTYNLPLIVIFVLMIITSCVFFLLPFKKIQQQENSILKFCYNFFDGIEVVKTNKIIFFKLVILVLCQFLIVSARLYIVFDIIDVDITCWLLLMIGPMTVLISFLNITPGNLGLREWAIGAISALSGVDFQGGVFAGSIDRVILMICTFIFGSFAMLYIYLKIKRFKQVLPT